MCFQKVFRFEYFVTKVTLKSISLFLIFLETRSVVTFLEDSTDGNMGEGGGVSVIFNVVGRKRKHLIIQKIFQVANMEYSNVGYFPNLEPGINMSGNTQSRKKSTFQIANIYWLSSVLISLIITVLTILNFVCLDLKHFFFHILKKKLNNHHKK